PKPQGLHAVPRSGALGGDPPRDPDWVDASRFGLERDGLLVEVHSVTIGPIEYQGANGARLTTNRPVLVVAIRRRRFADTSEFAGPARRRQRGNAPAVTLTMTDTSGKPLDPLGLDLSRPASGQTRRSGIFPSSATEDVAAFEVPAGAPADLRLEVAAPAL